MAVKGGVIMYRRGQMPIGRNRVGRSACHLRSAGRELGTVTDGR